MRTANMAVSRLLDLVTAAEHDVAQMMRQRMQQFLVVAILAQLPEVFIGVASVPMNGVVISPAH
jgi:hypothetical protein